MSGLMPIILLERVNKLGQMGEIVAVRNGYARNYLLPLGKALRANAANRARFDAERATLEIRNLERKSEAQKIADSLEGKSFIVVRSAGETGQLYGSVAARDVIQVLAAEGFNIGRNQVHLNMPIKAIGLHKVEIQLHAEVEIEIELNIARSGEEAQRQFKGEKLTSVDAIYGVDEDALRPEYFFDPEADDYDEDDNLLTTDHVSVDDRALASAPSTLTDAQLSISSIVTRMSSPDLGERVKGLREASHLLISLEEGKPMQIDEKRNDETLARFEASTLPTRLYERMFISEPREARAAAYALIVCAPDYRGKLDPSASPEKLNKSQLRQFRQGLLRLFTDVGVRFFSYVDAAGIDVLGDDKHTIHVFVKVSRKLPFDIGGESLMLSESYIDDPRLRITSPFALDVRQTINEAKEDGVIAAATADIIFTNDHLANDGDFPVTVSFNHAVETIDVPVRPSVT